MITKRSRLRRKPGLPYCEKDTNRCPRAKNLSQRFFARFLLMDRVTFIISRFPAITSVKQKGILPPLVFWGPRK